MKIALACQSVLLQKSLEIFLKSYVVSYKQCDFIMSDTKVESDKPILYIGKENSNLMIPFSKQSLIVSVDEFYKDLSQKERPVSIIKRDNEEELEVKIATLTNKFKDDLAHLIKEHYDN